MQAELIQEFYIKTKDADLNGLWRAGSIFLAMQEAGGEHSRLLGAGFFELREKNLAWVLSRVQLSMSRYPAIGEKVRLVTWPGEEKHGLFPRYYTFEDEKGQLYGCASTLWVLLDIKSRAMARPSSSGVVIECSCTRTPPLPMPGRIPKLTGEAQTFSRLPVYTDFDVNRHVNNTKYIDWLCNAFPVERWPGRGFSDILVHYSSEIRPGEPVELSLTADNQQVCFAGKCCERSCFSVFARWME